MSTPLSKSDFISLLRDVRDTCSTPEAIAKCDMLIDYASSLHDVRKLRRILAESLPRHIASPDALANAMMAAALATN